MAKIRVIKRNVGSGIIEVGSRITSHGIRISSFVFKDQESGCTILWDDGSKFVMLLESGIRILGTQMEYELQKYTLLRPRLMAVFFMLLCCEVTSVDHALMKKVNRYTDNQSMAK